MVAFMPKIVKILELEVDEKELESLLLKNPDVIEEDLRILGRQVQTDTGPLDLLATDCDKTLTVIELKNRIDDSQLDQGLRYYDWVRTHVGWIAQAYPNKVDIKQEPRLILIAPAFSENLKRIAKYVAYSIPLELLEYHVIELPSKEMGIICPWVEIGTIPEPAILPTKEGHLEYIENERVRKLCTDCLARLEDMGVEIRPKKHFWFSMFYAERQFMTLGCKRKFFVCYILKKDLSSWTERIRISKKTEWEKLFKEEIQPTYKTLSSGK